MIEQWATFGKEMSTAWAMEATGHAFSALAAERRALQDYHETCQTPTTDLSWSRVFYTHERIIEQLREAAKQWLHVASVLERGSQLPSLYDRSALDQGIPALIADALSQRLRVWIIAEHLLAEQMHRYQQEVPNA